MTSVAGCDGGGDADPTSAGDTEAATGETDGDDTADTGSSGSSGDESSSGSGGEPEHVDLFACEGVTASCDQIVQHIDPEPAEALECAGQLLASGQPGVISALDAPGPDIDETEHLILVLGDGTALVQTRGRQCSDIDGSCSPETLPWEPSSEHRLCTLDVIAELQAACDPACETDCNCSWDPFYGSLGECQPVADWSCDDAVAALSPT